MYASEKGETSLGKIWEFFETMNEYVYVADMDTYELIYMNRKTLEIYGFQSIEEAAGKKCYEVLQGNSSPCALCSNGELCEGQFKEWSFYNPLTQSYMELKETMVVDEGRRCRIQLGFDDKSRQSQNTTTKRYQNLERIANEGLRMALKTSSPDCSINIILEYIGMSLRGERTYVFERNEEGNDDNTYEWAANNVIPQKQNLQNLPAEVCANWYRKFQENQNILIKNLEDIREIDPLQYENLKRQNIHSLVVVPLYDDREVIGFYGVDNLPMESILNASDILQIMGHFIISCLKRRNLLQELRTMSHTDQLTGMGNRYAMNEYVERVQPGMSIGAVYCDITGLKRVNDTEGHEAGDSLIVRAADCMKRVFPEGGLFRIGGDEMLALCTSMDEQTLSEKVRKLREDMEKNDVVMAVGAFCQKGKVLDVDELLCESEKRMYADKAAYYKRTGIERRR